MEIKYEQPPNIQQIKKVYTPNENTVFTYGNTLYNPGKKPIDKWLMLHEEVHAAQQAEMGVEKWWQTYLLDKTFMLEQELEAYKAQYKRFCKDTKQKAMRVEYINTLAKHFGSDMYANFITPKEAKELIKS